jgi:hypothetical protein
MRTEVYKTCRKGHPLSPENLEVESRKGKLITRCRACRSGQDEKQRIGL